MGNPIIVGVSQVRQKLGLVVFNEDEVSSVGELMLRACDVALKDASIQGHIKLSVKGLS